MERFWWVVDGRTELVNRYPFDVNFVEVSPFLRRNLHQTKDSRKLKGYVVCPYTLLVYLSQASKSFDGSHLLIFFDLWIFSRYDSR